MASKRRGPEPGPEAIDVPDERRWNHNGHYHRVILDAVPDGAGTALDIGCGEGVLTRALRARLPSVTGLDLDEPSLVLARHQGPTDVRYVLGDILTHPFTRQTFDVVACVTALHHLDFGSGLRRMAELTAPGGVLAAVGVARRRWPHDLPWDLAGAVATRVLRPRYGEWHTPAPKVWPPPLTFAEHRRTASEILSGSRFRRHVLWRWSLVWHRPASEPG